MSRFAVDHLSPLAVRRRLEEVDLEEKSRLAEGLALIALMDSRGDYLEAGYSCMQAYCIEHLRMSEEKAQRRIRAARLGREFPGVLERIADGRLSVTNACELSPAMTSANAEALLDAVAHQPKSQVRRIAVEAMRAKAPATGAPARVLAAEEPQASESADAPSLSALCGVEPRDTPLTEAAPARVNRQVRGRVVVTQQGERGLQIVLTDEEFAAFEKAQDLLSHVVRNGDPAVIVARALAHFATHLEKRRFGAKKGDAKEKRVPRGRHIPAALRHEVAERDGYCCAFVSADGHRCGETRGVQFDHVTPLAHGGVTSADNLRLLCAHHNRHEAAKKIGAKEVAEKRELKERARAQERDAKQREEQRAAGRAANSTRTTHDPDSPATEAVATTDPADAELAARRERTRRQSDADTVAALKWMGIPLEEARFAAEQTASLADDPVGKRVLAARRLCLAQRGYKQDFRRKPETVESASMARPATAPGEHAV